MIPIPLLIATGALVWLTRGASSKSSKARDAVSEYRSIGGGKVARYWKSEVVWTLRNILEKSDAKLESQVNMPDGQISTYEIVSGLGGAFATTNEIMNSTKGMAVLLSFPVYFGKDGKKYMVICPERYRAEYTTGNSDLAVVADSSTG